jgi:uncharacterized cofD-like protein
MSTEQLLEPYNVPHSNLPRDIVVLGGGTGNSTVLTGLSEYRAEGLTAVVSPFDDGGGTGELRKAYPDSLAMGDLRQCAGAMAPENVQRLMGFRFGEGLESGVDISGQTLGNLALLAAFQQAGGNMTKALSEIKDVFQIEGNLTPVSHDNRILRFYLPNGTMIEGEHELEETEVPNLKGTRVAFAEEKGTDTDADKTEISGEAEAAIKNADIVVLAPGDAYTSIGPNLAVRGMKEALQSAKVVMMISNLMNRNRHTVGFTTKDYVDEYTRIAGGRFIDRVIYNTGKLDPAALAAQKKTGSLPVRPDVKGLKADGYTVRGVDLLSRKTVEKNPNDPIAHLRTEIRHDSGKLAGAILNVYLNNGFAEK